MKIQNNIATAIKLAMAEKNETLVEFAEEIGIARSSLQAYLKENANPRADTIELIAEKLGISPADLVSGTAYQTGSIHLCSETDESLSELSLLVQEIYRVYRYLGVLLSELKTMLENLEAQQNEKMEP